MITYADTGFLCSLYAPDAHTERAISWMEHDEGVIGFSWLNQIEFRNAMRLRVFRGEITTAQRDASINILLADLIRGALQTVNPPQDSLVLESERLSAMYSEQLGTRSLDILHVAMAIALGTSRFLSFDHRQLRLAQAVGLATPPL